MLINSILFWNCVFYLYLINPFVYKFLFDKPVLCTVIDDCNIIFHESNTSLSFTRGSNKKLPKISTNQPKGPNNVQHKPAIFFYK